MAESPAITPAVASTTPHDATPTVTPAPTEHSEDEKHLKSIFPDLDETTIHDCYVLCERNVERTVEFLLGTDHNDPPSNANPAPTGMSQSEMDEQLARQFEQEELAAAAAVWNPRVAAPPASNSAAVNRNYRSQEPQSAGSNEPNFQEQFNKFAETGKKTFSSIFNKVKEKIKEFEAPPPGGSSNPQMQQQQQYQYYAPEQVSSAAPHGQQGSSPTPYRSYAPPAVPPPGVAPVHQAPVSGLSSSAAAPITTQDPTASSSSPPPTVPPNIDLSKTAFLPRKPAPIPESKPQDLTESPFEDRDR